MRLAAAAGVALALFVGAAGPAFAASCPGPPGRKTAGKLSDRGLVAVDEGRHAEAARLFDDAFACDHHPTLLWNAARAYEKAGELDVARARYATYRGLPGLEAARAAEAGEKVRTIDDIQRRQADAGRGTGRALGRLRVPAASVVRSPEALPVEAAPPLNVGRGQRTSGYVLLGAGVAVAAVGFVFMSRANHAYDDLNREFADGIAEGDAVRWAQYEAGRKSAGKDADRDQRTMWAFFGAGAAVAVTGTVLVLTAPRGRTPSTRGDATVVGAAPIPGGAVAFGRVRFR
ncbi:MAG: hypothetical protein R3F39_21680 [Myxococcota bacterium]